MMYCGNCTNCGSPTDASHFYQYGFRKGKSYLMLLCGDCTKKLSKEDKDKLVDRITENSGEKNA